MTITTVPNPYVFGVLPTGEYVWWYHTRDIANDTLVCRFAIARHCPQIYEGPLVWFETEEAARLAWELRPTPQDGEWVSQMGCVPAGAVLHIDSQMWRIP